MEIQELERCDRRPEFCREIFSLDEDTVGFSKKGGMRQMVEIPDPFFRHGLVVMKQWGGEAGQGTRKIRKTERSETRFFAFFN